MTVTRAFTNLAGDWNWLTPSNWAASDFTIEVPAAPDDVVITNAVANGFPVTIESGDAEALSIEIGSGNQLLVGQSGSLTTAQQNDSIQVDSEGGDALIIQNGGSVTVAGGAGEVLIGGPAAGGGLNGSGLLVIGGANGVGNAAGSGTLMAGIVGLVTTGSLVKFNVNDSTPYTFSVAISGYGGLTQQGSTTVILTGANSYSGTTTISSGTTLQIGNGGASGSIGSGAIIDSGSLIFDLTSSSTTLTSAISGVGSIKFTGGGVFVVANPNAGYSGAVTIDAGASLALSGALGSGAVTNNGTLEFAPSTAATVVNALGGSGVVFITANQVTFTNSSTYSGATTVGGFGSSATMTGGLANAFSASSDFDLASGGLLDLGGFNQTIGGLTDSGNDGSSTVVDNLSANGATLTIAEQSTSEEFDGTIQDSQGGLALTLNATDDNNTFILGGDNTYTGTTTVSAGQLLIGDGGTSGSLGSGAVSVGANGSVIFRRSDQIDLSNTFSGAGSLDFQGGGVALLLANNSSFSGHADVDGGYSVQFGAASSAGSLGTAQIFNTGSLLFDTTGVVTQACSIGGVGQVLQFDGTTVLTGANSYGGKTSIVSGALKGGAANVFSANSVVDIASGATLDLGGFAQTIGGLTDDGAVTDSAGKTLTVSGGAGQTFTGTFSDANFHLDKTGAGTQIVTSTGAYSLISTISGGVLQIGDGGLDDLTKGAFTVNAGGALTFDIGGKRTLAQPIAISGAGAVNFEGSYIITSGQLSYSGLTTIGAGSSVSVGTGSGSVATFGTGAIVDNGSLFLDRTGAQTVGNSISGTGSLSTAAGTVTLTGGGAFNNYSGGTTVISGTLKAGVANAFGFGTVTVDANATLDLGGFEDTGAIVNNGTVTLSTGGSDLVGAFANNGVISVTGAILDIISAVTGTGTVTISGGGVLNFGGAFNQNVTLQGGSTLGLTQSYGGVISGFAPNDVIDVYDVLFAAGQHLAWQATSNGVQTWALENASNAVIQTFKFAGRFSADDFSVSGVPGVAAGSAFAIIGDTRKATPPPDDFNGDVMSDVLWRNLTSGLFVDWSVVNGAFAGSHNIAGISPTSGWTFAGTGDFNGDGTGDILFKFSNGALLDWQMSNGTFSSQHIIGSVPAGFALVGTGDFNGDGTTDLLIQNTTSGLVEDKIVTNNTAAAPTVIGVAAPSSGWKIIDTGDFNGDGQTDILWQNSNSHALLDWTVSNGQFQGQNVLKAPAANWAYVGNGDFDGDGTSDLLFEYSNGALSEWQMKNGIVAVTHNLGIAVASGFSVVRIGDFNGDGVADVLTENASTGAAEVGIVTNGTIAKWTVIGGAAPSGGWHFAA
jgi:autotransporter-associated beta strand protein